MPKTVRIATAARDFENRARITAAARDFQLHARARGIRPHFLAYFTGITAVARRLNEPS